MVKGNRRESKQGRYKVAAKTERTVDGIVFDSKLEARFYAYIRSKVSPEELHLQPEFLLQPKCKDLDGRAVRAISYKADFLLGPKRENPEDPLEDIHVVIDAKGHKTEVFRIKAKMFVYHYSAKLWAVKNIKELDEALARYHELRGA